MSDRMQSLTRTVALIALGLVTAVYVQGGWRPFLLALVVLTLWAERQIWKQIVRGEPVTGKGERG